MPVIVLHTNINASQEIVFDLSRSIDLHKVSTAHTHEEAIAGRTEGLIGLGESVTWRAKHLGLYQELTTYITAFDSPNFFTDEMQKGAFKRFKHDHFFREENKQTIMTDVFDYTSPFGLLGKLADVLFLKNYMTRLLIKRNEIIKSFAESGKWKEILGNEQQ